jgi:rare lipoprotein A (peptidoglycan hydrolase)/uncharacterized protein YkwD
MEKLKRLSFFVAAFLLFSQVSYAVFTDVASNHKYYEAIEYLQENGIVEGYEDGSYRPDAKVNRAEALKIILLGSNILVPEIAEQDIFPDVLYGTWYGKYVAKAKNKGIVSGDGDTGMFRPGDTINLAEIVKILLETNDIEPVYEMSRRPYADVPTEAWFAPYFAYADSIALLEEDDEYNVFPATPVTRGLMAQLMYQLQMKPEGYQEGEASYYGEKFHGKGTASGEVFDASEFTAAHRTLPFDTWLKVRNLANDMEVYVRVNDRGPYAGENRIIDLSKAAFESIASLSSGVIQVSITPVSGPPGGSNDTQASADCPDKPELKYFSENTFENIILSASLPNTFLADEVFFLTGISASSQSEVSVFLADDNENQFPFLTETGEGGSFGINLYFPSPGEYQLGILPGQHGTSIVESITVLPASCLNTPEDPSLPVPAELMLSVAEGDLAISWTNDPSFDTSKVTFIQGAKQKSYFVRDQRGLIPYYPNFEGWSTGDIQLQIRGATSPPLTSSFRAEIHEQYIVDEEKVRVLSLPGTLRSGSPLSFKVDPKVNLDEIGWVILPSGQVEEVLLQSPTHSPLEGNLGINIYPSSSADVRLSYTPKSGSLHFVEINDDQGIAAVNIPVYPENIYPLIPSPVDLADLQPQTLSSNLGALENEMLGLVNADRAAHGLGPVSLNSSLSQLAQSRSNDMAARDYFGHWNPEGLTANDLRKDFAIAQFVSENIARDVNVPLAEYGLMRSASHRDNILNAEWQRAGFGFSQDGDNGTVFVQIFSDDPIDFSNIENLRTEIASAINTNRSSDIALQNSFNTVAQSWTDKWAADPWCDLNENNCNPWQAPDGSSFDDLVADNDITSAYGAIIRGDSSFDFAKSELSENDQLQDYRFKKLGIGIKQDLLGIIHSIAIYSE